VIDTVGPPPEGVQWLHVMDRGADNFEVYCHCREQCADWVVRVTQKQRRSSRRTGGKCRSAPTSKRCPWQAATSCICGHAQPIESGPAAGAKGHGGTSFRAAAGALSDPSESVLEAISRSADGPVGGPCRRGERPKDVEPIEWILLASLPVESFDDAWLILGYYEKSG